MDFLITYIGLGVAITLITLMLSRYLTIGYQFYCMSSAHKEIRNLEMQLIDKHYE